MVKSDETAYRRLLSSVVVQLRGIRGMSQATLAERVGRSEAAVSRWETAKATPSAMDLVRMAEAFELGDDQLDMLIRPPKGPVSPVAVRLEAAVEAGGRTGRSGAALPRTRSGAA